MQIIPVPGGHPFLPPTCAVYCQGQLGNLFVYYAVTCDDQHSASVMYSAPPAFGSFNCPDPVIGPAPPHCTGDFPSLRADDRFMRFPNGSHVRGDDARNGLPSLAPAGVQFIGRSSSTLQPYIDCVCDFLNDRHLYFKICEVHVVPNASDAPPPPGGWRSHRFVFGSQVALDTSPSPPDYTHAEIVRPTLSDYACQLDIFCRDGSTLSADVLLHDRIPPA